MNQKKSNSKLKSIRLLMIAGYVLLLCFSVQWLMGQFYKEENDLQKEIAKLFDNVQEGITDSLLLVSINNATEPQLAPKYVDNSGISLNEDSLKRLSALLSNKSNKDLALQGVSLVLKKVRQLTPAEKQTLFHIDTTAFNEEFLLRMRRHGWNFPVAWVNEANTPMAELKGIYIPNRYILSGHGIIVSDYKQYLIKDLWMQFVFVLVLQIVILLAFFVTYKSLLRQLQLSEMKDDFVSNISHELKTPIATVKVALEAIQHFEAAGQKDLTAEYMQMASLEMERLELLVNRSLHTSLLESGRLSLQLEQVNIQTIIKEVLLAYQVKFLAYDADIELKIIGENFDALADKLHLQGVLVNLLDNSLKYGLGKIFICVELQSINDKILIRVIDNGPGIPDEYRKKVFEKFFRVPMQDRHNVKGYGLGLTYAAQVIGQHKGSIEVVNLAEGGCAFSVYL